MTIDDERQSEQSGTPPEDATGSDQTQGTSPAEPAAGPASGPSEGPTAPQAAGPTAPAGGPPTQPGWPPAAQGWPPAAQGLPPAAQGLPPAAQGLPPAPGAWPPAAQGLPPAQQPQAPQGWPPAPQGWPPSPQAWPPAQQAWPPSPQAWPPAQQPQAPQGWPPSPQGWPPSPQAWPPAQQSWPTAPQTPPSPRSTSASPTWPPTPPADLVFDGAGRLVSPDSQTHRRPSRLPLILSAVAAVMIAFAGGMVVDHLTVSAQQTAQNEPLKDFTIYDQAVQDIRQNYVGSSSITDQQLLYGSISGMVDALGDTGHSRFLTPEEYKQEMSELSGTVAGIGVLVTQSNGELLVERVIAGSPAAGAGVLAGDQITAVNGTSTSGMTFDQLAAAIRGDPGTKVTISVIHPGATTSVDITMTRATVTAPIVDWGIVPGTHIADIALYEFDDGASDQVKQAIDGAKAAGATAIVLDLRGDPGGLAEQARSVASEFLSKGNVYLEQDASGKQTPITVDTSFASTEAETDGWPMVVLVDHDTASAAEIVAGALQDSGRASIVGLTTVGTGTVLEPFTLSDGSVILLGIEDWLTPDGHLIFGKGITPDQTVALPSGAAPIDPINLGGMTAVSLQSSGDAQLLAAVADLSQ